MKYQVDRFRLTVLLIGYFLLSGSRAGAQDIHFSQFEYSPLNLNPAYTGAFDGDLRFTGLHRNQYSSVTVPYSTFSGSFDMAVDVLNSFSDRLSAGIIINSDKAGDGNFGTLQASLSVAYSKSLNSDSTSFASGGIQLGGVQRSIDFNQLYFDNQYNGDVFVPSASSGENFAGSKFIYFDLSAGVSYKYVPAENFDIGAGISLQHINQPKQTFFNDNSVDLFPKWTFDVSSKIKVQDQIDLLPSLLWMDQNKFQEVTFGSNVRFDFKRVKGKSLALYAGVFARLQDAIIPTIGFDYNSFHAGVSYDFNTSDLKRASNGKGGYEFSLLYIIKKVKPLVKHPPCPVY